MKMERNTGSPGGFAALHRLLHRPAEPERCALCGNSIPGDHSHLVDPASRRLLCACQACSILFDEAGTTRFRRVPRDVRLLDITVADDVWNATGVPIGLVFFFRSTATAGTLAIYPSPAGPAEVSVDADRWTAFEALHPALNRMRPDIEALLVNRMRGRHEYFLAPIDHCYRLVGLIRRSWSGWSGGDGSQLVEEFFANLRVRAIPSGARAGA